MGDIILTTPILRSLKRALPEAEIHFLVKDKFKDAIALNPYITKLHIYRGSFSDTTSALQAESFDVVLDLHKNLRSLRLRWALGVKSYSFQKFNWTKFRMTRLKQRGLVVPHIVERYAAILKPLGITLDGGGLDFPILPEVQAETDQEATNFFGEDHFYAIVLGATWFTKRWPEEKIVAFIQQYNKPVVLLGGPSERAMSERIAQQIQVQHLNLAGKATLQQSAVWLERAEWMLTHDTGLMHIGAALGKKMVSLWGNTVPEFGMYPWKTDWKAAEVKDLDCRPCSRIGYDKCPKGHFRCMQGIEPVRVIRLANELLNKPSQT
jgi:ADP-heptose:LPS heptosyltransferase